MPVSFFCKVMRGGVRVKSIMVHFAIFNNFGLLVCHGDVLSICHGWGARLAYFRPSGGMVEDAGVFCGCGEGGMSAFPAVCFRLDAAWRVAGAWDAALRQREGGMPRRFVIPFLYTEAFRLGGKWCPGLCGFPFSGQKIAVLRHTFSGFAARRKFLSAKTGISFRKEIGILAGKCPYGAVPAAVF